MKRLKLITTVDTYPEIIRISTVIKKADKYFDHVLMHMSQNYNYSLSGVSFGDLALRAPDYYLGIAGNNIGGTVGNVISEAYNLMTEIKPGTVIALGDTNLCLLVIAARRLRIPIFHMEVGNRCKGENPPEEVVYRIVGITFDVNLCHSEHICRYILQSSVKPEYTYAVSSPMAGTLSSILPQIGASNILNKLDLEKGRYTLLSAHREENIDIEQNFFSLVNTVNEVTCIYDMPILYNYHSHLEKVIGKKNFRLDERTIQHRSLDFFDYNKPQRNTSCVISDSGTVPEEGVFFHFPAVSVRTSTERPKAMDKDVFTTGSITSEAICQAVELATATHANGDDACPVPAYTDDNVSTKVTKLIQSYIGTINKMVWRES